MVRMYAKLGGVNSDLHCICIGSIVEKRSQPRFAQISLNATLHILEGRPTTRASLT